MDECREFCTLVLHYSRKKVARQLLYMHIHVVGEILRVSPLNNELNVLSPRLGYHMSHGMVYSTPAIG